MIFKVNYINKKNALGKSIYFSGSIDLCCDQLKKILKESTEANQIYCIDIIKETLLIDIDKKEK